MARGEEFLERERAAPAERMVGARHAHVVLVEQPLAADLVAQLRHVADREVDVAGLHAHRELARRQLRGLEAHRRAVLVQVAHERGQQHGLADVGHVDAQAARGAARVERLARAERAAHHGERVGERRRELERARRRQHAAARVHEQRIVELAAQPAERAAHRRLREAHVRGRARDVAVAQQRLEHRQQVQIRCIHLFTAWMKRINAIDLTDNYRCA